MEARYFLSPHFRNPLFYSVLTGCLWLGAGTLFADPAVTDSYFEDLKGKTFNEGAEILGIDPDALALPTLSLELVRSPFIYAGVLFNFIILVKIQPTSNA